MLLKKCFDSIEIHREEKIIIFKLLEPYRLISTCRIGGGLREDVRFVCNHQCCEPCDHFTSINAMMVEDPGTYHTFISDYYGLPSHNTVILETAANMNNASIETARFRDLEITVACTAGVETNSMRAGDPADIYEIDGRFEIIDDGSFSNAGTINMIIFINRELTPPALTDCVVTATEAKAAALQELGINSRYSDALATGTGTDQILVAAPIGNAVPLSDARKHTKLGELIGRTCMRAIRETLVWQNSLTPNVQCSCVTHLGRLCPDEQTFCDGVGRFLSSDQSALFRKNIESINLDPPTVAALAALAHVRYKCLWGVLPESCIKEILASQGAIIAAAVSGKYTKLSYFFNELSDRNVSIDPQKFVAFVYECFALGFAEKWPA
jgi:adenosylcobinamide amidohydrolase